MIRIALALVCTIVLGGCADSASQGPVEDRSEAAVPSEPPEEGVSPLASLSPSEVAGAATSSGGWTELPAPPLSPRWGPVVAWVGEQAVVVGGRDTPPCPSNASCVPPEEPALSDGAVY